MRTRGALLWEVGQPWSVEAVDIGDPGPGEVLVRLVSAGLCHTDHHLRTGSLPSAAFPVLGGHEGAGVIAAVGPDVDALAVGDHVVTCAIPSYGGCSNHQAGQQNSYSSRVTARGRDVHPASRLGTFAPYAVVPQASVVKIDPAVPLTVAWLLGCAVLTGHGAATRSAAVRAGEDVAVIGLGGVGMSAVQGAHVAGARRIFAIDPVAWKRDMAVTLGATHVYSDVGSAMSGIANATNGFMAHEVIVAVGDVEGKDVDGWLILTAKGGTCVLAALGNANATDVTLNLAINILQQKRLQGSLLGGGNPHHDIPLLASMYLAGKLVLDDMVTREYRLGEINDGFEDMLAGNVVRGMIRYTEDDWST